MSLSHVPIKMETLFCWMHSFHSHLLNVYDNMCIRVWPGGDDQTHSLPYVEYALNGGYFTATDMFEYDEDDNQHRGGERPRWYLQTENRVHPM